MAIPIVKLRKLVGCYIVPEMKSVGASGYDLYSSESFVLRPRSTELVRTGIAIEAPKNIDIQIRGRESLAVNGIFTHFGTIDSDFRGEICVILYNSTIQTHTYKRGTKIGELVFSRGFNVKLEVVESFEETEEE
jgi:dUTP pyrophosphatase